MFTFDDATFIWAWWHVEWPRVQNWSAVALQRDGQPWEGVYRFRYYRDAKAFDSDDKKAWYSVKPNPNDARTLSADLLEEMFDTVAYGKWPPHASGALPEVHKVLINARGVEAFDLIATQPWIHVQRVKR